MDSTTKIMLAEELIDRIQTEAKSTGLDPVRIQNILVAVHERITNHLEANLVDLAVEFLSEKVKDAPEMGMDTAEVISFALFATCDGEGEAVPCSKGVTVFPVDPREPFLAKVKAISGMDLYRMEKDPRFWVWLATQAAYWRDKMFNGGPAEVASVLRTYQASIDRQCSMTSSVSASKEIC